MGRIGLGEEWSCLRTSEETVALGKQCGIQLSRGSVVALFGDLGAGKTTFVQGIAAALGIEEPIQSPTFTYLHIYQGTMPLYHFDLYRMNGHFDFFSMGFEEYFDSDGITVIEWAERLGHTLPENALSIHLSHHEGGRSVRILSNQAFNNQGGR